MTVASVGCFSRPDQKRVAASRDGATPAASPSPAPPLPPPLPLPLPLPPLPLRPPTPSRLTAEAAIRSNRSSVTLGH